MNLTYAGKTFSIHNWARLRDLSTRKIHDRITKLGWTVGQALEFDPKKKRDYSKPRLVSRLTELPEQITLITKTVVVIDSVAIGKAAKLIRKSAGVRQDVATKQMRAGGIPSYAELEIGRKKWTPELVEKFNAVAATWVVETQHEA